MVQRSRVIRVKVVDDNGYGCQGVKVQAYGGDTYKTDRDGEVTLSIDSAKVTIYVNGRTRYDGFTDRCDNPLIVEV